MQCILRYLFNQATSTQIYTLSLHDALPISAKKAKQRPPRSFVPTSAMAMEVTFDDFMMQVTFTDGRVLQSHLHHEVVKREDRKSTRLNSSHVEISYAVFCLKKKIHHLLN